MVLNGGMTNPSQHVTFNDGNSIPQLGFGTWQLLGDDCYNAVRTAIDTGYRHIDTARIYDNEEEVGRAVADAIAAGDIEREDLFITTKLWNYSHDKAPEAFEASLDRLGLDYVDTYLIHWPFPAQKKYVQAWKDLIRIQGVGRVRSIGVANFYEETLDELREETGVVPVMNQVELHPGFSQASLRAYHDEHDILTEAWSPLGRGDSLNEQAVTRVAEEVDATPAQVIIAWHLALGSIVIPKSGTKSRVEENFAALDVALSDSQIEAITALDADGGRSYNDPREWPELEN